MNSRYHLRPQDQQAGWECMVAGVCAVEFSEEGRMQTTKHVLSDGSSFEHVRKSIEIIDRGVWKSGEYERGDTVSWDGSSWTAQRDTDTKPGTNTDWRLSTKRGRDGKDGTPGPKGEKGSDGRAGRDLTHMMPDGTRY